MGNTYLVAINNTWRVGELKVLRVVTRNTANINDISSIHRISADDDMSSQPIVELDFVDMILWMS